MMRERERERERERDFHYHIFIEILLEDITIITTINCIEIFGMTL